MTEKNLEVEVAVLSQRLLNNEDELRDTTKDIKDIKNDLGAINTNLALVGANLEKTLNESLLREEKLHKNYNEIKEQEMVRADVTQQIYGEIQEMKSAQEVMYNNIINKDAEQDRVIKGQSKSIEEVIETCRKLNDKIDEQANKTKIDFSSLLGKGLTAVFSDALKIGIISAIIYMFTQMKK